MEEKFFNPLRESHIEFAGFLEKQTNNFKDKELRVVKFGHSTQHVFIDGVYWMTIDWNKI